MQALTGGRGADCALLAAPGQAAFDQAVRGHPARAAGSSPSPRPRPARASWSTSGASRASRRTLLTAYSSSIDLQQEAAELVFSRTVRVAELVSHRLPVARGREAFELAMGRAPGTLKVLLDGGSRA